MRPGLSSILAAGVSQGSFPRVAWERLLQNDRTNRPNVSIAFSELSVHGLPEFNRMQFLKRWVGEKIGPGAMLMPCANAI